jgi:hypothetical protein
MVMGNTNIAIIQGIIITEVRRAETITEGTAILLDHQTGPDPTKVILQKTTIMDK